MDPPSPSCRIALAAQGVDLELVLMADFFGFISQSEIDFQRQ